MMASSSSINLNPKIKFSDKLFFDQYKYCIRGELPWVEVCKSLNKDRIKSLLDMWDSHRHYRKKINFGGSWKNKEEYYLPELLEPSLYIANRWFVDHQQDVKLQFFRDKVFIYTNNQHHLNELNDLNVYVDLSVTEINLDRPRDTVKARYPGFIVRAYLRPMHITHNQREALTNFITTNESEIRTNVGLERFISLDPKRYNYYTLRDYFFVDLRDERLLSVLELMCPGLIRKTVDIIYDDK